MSEELKNVKLPTSTHLEAKLQATREGKSLSAWLAEVVKKALAGNEVKQK